MGPQETFSKSSADIAIYGGAAGGGKTYAMLLEPLRFMEVSGFNSVIFRRTSEQVRMAGGLWDESWNIYPSQGAKGREQTLDWHFPQGSSIHFEQLQYEQTKYQYQGAQIALLCFDELTHFTETQFWYMLSRNRSTCGVKPYTRATCNPDARSWVRQFIGWWIGDDGLPILSRSGVKRFFVRVNDEILWGDSRAEMKQRFPEEDAMSLTFVPAKLSDNKKLEEKDPSYRRKLKMQPRVERERLEAGNWNATEDSIIDKAWLRYFDQRGEILTAIVGGKMHAIDQRQCRRFATIDTAGTSRDKQEESKGKPCSWSVCAIWDYWQPADLLFLRHVWRGRVGWNDLKERVPSVLKIWHPSRVYIENAHVGPALRDELSGFNRELVGPTISGMSETNRGAKLDRAIASGILNRFEDGMIRLPRDEQSSQWHKDYVSELTTWSGMPDETADQIDVSSYAAYVCKKQGGTWGGVVNVPTRGVGF